MYQILSFYFVNNVTIKTWMKHTLVDHISPCRVVIY